VHLTALIEHPDHVCCRYRLAAFRPFLERAGHTLELVALPRRPWERLWLYRHLRGAAVILQRKLLPPWEIALLRWAARWLVFDFDDAVFLRDSYAAKGLHDRRRLRRFAATIRACDAVAAGNPFLARNAARWTSPGRIYIVPTCVDPALYPTVVPRRQDSGVQLVWVGSSSTLRGLEAVRPMLEQLGSRVPGATLKLICDRFLSFDPLSVVACPWTEVGEAAEIAAADVGVSWIPDDDWSRGKCGLKSLQYMAAGLPVVANPVGVHIEMVRHGETGFLAETTQQWVEAVGQLARDPALRQRMGKAGRRLLEEKYSVARGAEHWLSLLNGLRRGERRAA
jgi:glycosyltransferase involved in cell wall biosynthesis